MEITSTIEINAPRAAVFEVFSDLGSMADHIKGITNIEVHGDGPVGVGSSWTETRKMFGKEATETMTFASFDPPAGYTVTAASNGAEYVSTYTFEEADGGTRVTMRFTGEAQGFIGKIMAKLMNAMMAKTMRKMLDADMQDLKDVCEGMS